MIAQIARTARMLDECHRPMKLSLLGMWSGRQAFVCGAVIELEATAPEVVASMVAQAASVYTISEDGTQAINSRGIVRWDAAKQPTGLTRAHDHNQSCIRSAAACALKNTDLYIFMSQPCEWRAPTNDQYCRSMPSLTNVHTSKHVLFNDFCLLGACSTSKGLMIFPMPFISTSQRIRRAYSRRGFGSTCGMSSWQAWSG
eukprot:SAG31_NODE_7118_length_1784_cov_1.503858_2_plen_200_part_00